MSRLSKLGVLVLGMAVVACGGTAAPVNVEGTVQARVSATVGAAARATATRPPPATTVIALGTPGTPGATVSAAAGSTGTPATPGSTGTPPASGTASGTGTALRTTTPAGTATIVGTLAAGTAGPTPAPPLALGAFARFGGFSATIVRYEWNTACPGGTGRAAPGAKFVLLQGVGQNDGSGALNVPPLIWAVESTPAGASLPCRPEGRSFDEACARSGLLPAGARCEGWLLFEVPEALEVPGALVTARVAGTQVTPGPTTLDVGRWRLPG